MSAEARRLRRRWSVSLLMIASKSVAVPPVGFKPNFKKRSRKSGAAKALLSTASICWRSTQQEGAPCPQKFPQGRVKLSTSPTLALATSSA
jgi:hypothetical protein